MAGHRIEYVDAAETATRTCAAAGELVTCVGGPMTGGSLQVTPGARAAPGRAERIEGVLAPVLRRSPRIAWFVAVDVAG